MYICARRYIFILYLCISDRYFTCLFIILAVEFSWTCYSGAIWSDSYYWRGNLCCYSPQSFLSAWSGWSLFVLLFNPYCFVCNLHSLGQTSWFKTKRYLHVLLLSFTYLFETSEKFESELAPAVPPDTFLVKTAPRYAHAYIAFLFFLQQYHSLALGGEGSCLKL